MIDKTMPHEFLQTTTDTIEKSVIPPESEQPQEIPAVDDIPVVLVPIEYGPRAGQEMYVFSYGSKQMELCFLEHQGIIEADTYVETMEGDEHIPGETTRLYKKVHALCQEIANTQQKPVNYTFTTGYPQMMKWALSAGNEIFQWDSYSDLTRFGKNTEKLNEEYPFGAFKKYWPATPK